MPDDPKPDPELGADDPKPVTGDDPNAGAKTALAAERKARRDAEAKSKDLEQRLAAIEDKDKTEVERLTAQVASLTTDLATATVTGARLKVALEKGLTATQAKRLVGDTEEDLSADADELLADLAPSSDPSAEKKDPPPGGKPREQLKPGNGDPDVGPDPTKDLKSLGASMFEDA